MSGSEDDLPLAARAPAPPAKPAENGAAAPGPAAANGAIAPAPARRVVDDSESEDDVPLAARAPQPAPAAKPAAPAPAAKPTAKPPLIPKQPGLGGGGGLFGDAVALPSAPKAAPKPKAAALRPAPESGSDDDEPLVKRKPAGKPAPGAKAPAAKKARREPAPAARERPPAKRKVREGSEQPQRKKARSGSPSRREGTPSKAEKRWDTLEHAGVLFPPEYQPHGVKMLYDGVPVDLTPEQEEVATFFAVMKDTDYMSKPTFLKNFWEGFREVLGPRHVIQDLELCDFTPIYEWHMAERERKKALSKEEKEALKREKEAAEAKYKWAVVDGRREQVGNFRVEPPGLFRGRGEHPKMGKLKKRIYPRDITINIGPGMAVPEHPYPGQQWKEVRHDKSVTWLAYWRDPVNQKEYKYVFLAANSTWKSESDQQKYEKARKLKDCIDSIRETYTANWGAADRKERQMATALYFIDKLALRAGHEKDEDEADTVGCCTLKCENVECLPGNRIKFDFLGKDSIRYENTVEVEPRVYKNVALFKGQDGAGRPKDDGDQLFEQMDAQDLNVRLKSLMDGLSVKVFRTYNASITLDRLLFEEEIQEWETVDGKKAHYDRANKEVAILCNHQRSVPKGHQGQMAKMQEKLAALRDELKELEAELKAAKAGKPGRDGRKVGAEQAAARVEKKAAQIKKAEITASVKEDLKTVALGTSKINYLDPRITAAWCKRHEVPIEKVFNKSLLTKFLWAMEVDPDFRF